MSHVPPGITEADLHAYVDGALEPHRRAAVERHLAGHPEQAEQVVTTQLAGALRGLSVGGPSALAIAYEPVWAIGTGRNAFPDDAGVIAGIIREQLRSILGSEIGDGVRVLYGGSVNAANIKDFMAKKDIDGALVGGASLDPDQFAAIVRYRL